MAAEFPYTVKVFAQGASDAFMYEQPFENEQAALSLVMRERDNGRTCRLYRTKPDGTQVREAVEPIEVHKVSRVRIGNR